MSSANLVALKYLAESVAGTTPGAALTLLRSTSNDFNGNITTTTSGEIRSDRAVADLIRTEGTTEGSFDFEMSYGSYDPFFESALMGAWSAALSFSAITVSAASADNSINDSGAGFSTTDILPGHWIKIAGFATAGNNGLAKVVSVTTSKIVVSGLTLTDEAAGATVTLAGSSVRNGVTRKTFTVEREFTDLATTFWSAVGMDTNTMSMTVSTGSIVTGSFALRGRASTWGAATVGTGPDVAAATTEVMSGVANVGTIYENGTAVSASSTCISSLTLNTNNNLRDIRCIGNLYQSDIAAGTFNATIDLNVYFSVAAKNLLQKFLDGTSTSFSFEMVDNDGNYYVFDFPYVKFSAGTTSGVSLDSDVMADLTMTALNSPTLGYMMQISRIPA